MPRHQEHITAIEIGTRAIKTCMGLVDDESVLEVIGYEELSTQDCVRKGEIVSTNAVLEQLTKVLNQLESSTKRPVETVYLAVTGNHFKSTNVTGTVPVTNPDRVITEKEIIEATKNAREWHLPPGQFWVASFQRTYIIDDDRRVSKPLGMVGNRLSADNHMIYGDHNRIETLLRLVRNVLGDPVRDIVFSGIASYYGVQHQDTHDRGTLVIDIGRGITEFVLFYQEGCMHSGQIAIGCDHLANDLALGLRLPLDLCRELVVHHGSAVVWSDGALRKVPVPDHQDKSRSVPEGCIHRIMELRLQELFEIIRDELDDQNLRGLLGDSVVLTGGGALIPNVTDLAQQVFKVPTRIGRPPEVAGVDDTLMSPCNATPIGLLYVGQRLNQIQTRPQPLHKIVKQEVSNMAELVWRAFKI